MYYITFLQDKIFNLKKLLAVRIKPSTFVFPGMGVISMQGVQKWSLYLNSFLRANSVSKVVYGVKVWYMATIPLLIARVSGN